MTRGNVLATAVAFLVPALASAQGVEIDHKAVGCIVVGKFPKMNACLTPAANVARARVYFRPEGTPSWYYVDMKSDQPCFSGVLPKPGKKLVGKKIEYYVETQDKTFNAARTAEYGPIVVNSAQECKKQVPVAPFVNNATVAVFPAVPAGFVGGGLGTAAVVGVAAAGAAAAGTAAVVATNDSNNDTTTTTAPVAANTTTTTLAPAATTTTTTTTTQTPRANRAPVAVLTTTPDPPSGPDPLTVEFDLCRSTDPDGDRLNFFFNFGDGANSSDGCLVSHTYSGTFRGTGQLRKADRSYNAEACVVDESGASQCRTRTVNVQTTPPPTTLAPCGNPAIAISQPKNGQTVLCDVTVVVSTTNTDSVTACAESSPCGSLTAAQQAAIGAVASASQPPTCRALSQSGSTFSGDVPLPGGFGCFQVKATGTNSCGGGTASAGPVQVFNSCGSAIRKGEGSAAVWSSDLKLDGGRLQVVVNGDSMTYPERGRTFGTSRLREGTNRMEATVVEAAGRAGSWRIDLSGSEAVEIGSLRVIAGEVESVSSSAITFKLKGFAGERVAFSFASKR
jgi:hypothetical protein